MTYLEHVRVLGTQRVCSVTLVWPFETSVRLAGYTKLLVDGLTSFKLTMVEKQEQRTHSEIKQSGWKNRQFLKIILLRVFPIITFTVGVLLLVSGWNSRLEADGLRMVGVTSISFSVFWCVLGNFVDFCVNDYGKGRKECADETATSSTFVVHTEVSPEEVLVEQDLNQNKAAVTTGYEMNTRLII